ncbi:MAG: hypothetical protein ACMUIS_02345 [bacterium]
MDIKSKLCNKPIVIDDWRQDDTYEGVYPKGARDKSAYFSPESADELCLKGNYRYLFKLSRSWCPWQFWSEIIAYRLGLIIGVEVPPSHIALSNRYNEPKATYGALIEWFYDDKKDLYIEGGQLMVGIIEGYDRQRGTQHNFSDIARIFRKLPEFIDHWSGVLTLDCLMGNTDRHQDNWGIILKDAKIKMKRSKRKSLFSSTTLFSPAFDNGTALGYEIIEGQIDKYDDEVKLESYLTNPKHARHHMKFALNEKTPVNFYDFILKFVRKFPDARSLISNHLSFSRPQVEEVMSPLVEAVSDNTYCLSHKRLCFMMKLIFRRKELLEKKLGL